jgi:hypothetical protein
VIQPALRVANEPAGGAAALYLQRRASTQHYT